jgi:Ca2+-binding EF-hand superfamily protein
MVRHTVALALLLVPGLALLADEEKEKGKLANLSPQLAAQLGAMFERMDLNKDAYLDREELAKAFRGPRAKPVPMAEDDPDKKDAKPGRPMPVMPEDDFLKTWDKNTDAKISVSEFERWGVKFEQDMRKAQGNRGWGQNPWQQYMQQWQKAMREQQQQQNKNREKDKDKDN